VTELPSIYEPLLVYDLALEFGELIDNLSPEFAAKKTGKMVYLRERRSDAYTRVEKWRRSQKGAAPNRRRAFNDRSGGCRTLISLGKAFVLKEMQGGPVPVQRMRTTTGDLLSAGT
jgi:hypothetical protein